MPNSQNPTALVSRLSRALHDLDPMNTCCHVNEGMEDEYDSEARQIVHLLQTDIPLHQAVKLTFDAKFWTGCLEEPAREQGLAAVTDRLAEFVSQEG